MTDGTDATPARFVDDQSRYRLDARIATGGMGEVWRATDTALDRPVAVKVLKSEYADDPLFRSRFETEARHAASLHHPGVASVYDVGESALLGREDGSAIPRPFLVMELVDGQPLSALLRGGRPLDPAVVRDLMAQTADALGAAHRAGIVHRDVKPANLLVTPDRNIKITDFGIARASDGLGLTGTGQVMGTPQYLSPEQARGTTATPTSDVYALGVVAFECLVGHRPFEAESPVATALAHLNDPVPDLPPTVPADLAAVVRRALAKDPAERFADGDAFAAALRDPAGATALVAPADAQTTQVIGAVPPPDPSQPDPLPEPAPLPLEPEPLPLEPERRRTWPMVLLVLAVVAAVVLVIVLIATAGNDDGSDGDDDPSADQTRSSGPATPESSAPPSSEDTPTEETSPEPAEVTVNERDYLGRPLDDVVSELKGKGLNVETQAVDNPGDEEADTVAAVRPSGTLKEGDTVTVGYYREAEPSEEPSPTPSQTDSPTPPPPSDTGQPTPSSTPPTPSQSSAQSSTPPASSSPSATVSQVAGGSPSPTGTGGAR